MRKIAIAKDPIIKSFIKTKLNYLRNATNKVTMSSVEYATNLQLQTVGC